MQTVKENLKTGIGEDIDLALHDVMFVTINRWLKKIKTSIGEDIAFVLHGIMLEGGPLTVQQTSQRLTNSLLHISITYIKQNIIQRKFYRPDSLR